MDAAGGEKTYSLVINYRMNVYRILNVRSDTYTHLQLLSDVSDLVLRNVPINVSLYIILNLHIPGTRHSMEVLTDDDLKTMFLLYSKSENIDINLRVTQNPPLLAPPDKIELGSWLLLDDVRRKGKMFAETEDLDELLSMGPDAYLNKLAGILRTHILKNDGHDEAGFFSNDNNSDLSLQAAAIFKSLSTLMLLPPAIQPDGKFEPAVDDVEIEQWLNFIDSPDQ
ncbi:unnamed protein product [Rhodiola kirilowii]